MMLVLFHNDTALFPSLVLFVLFVFVLLLRLLHGINCAGDLCCLMDIPQCIRAWAGKGDGGWGGVGGNYKKKKATTKKASDLLTTG